MISCSQLAKDENTQPGSCQAVDALCYPSNCVLTFHKSVIQVVHSTIPTLQPMIWSCLTAAHMNAATGLAIQWCVWMWVATGMWGGGESGDGVGIDMQHVASQIWQN